MGDCAAYCDGAENWSKYGGMFHPFHHSLVQPGDSLGIGFSCASLLVKFIWDIKKQTI